MRIILVDPSRAVQRIMTELIERDEHQVHSFSDGRQALECIGAEDDIRALITSVQLGDMSGLQLCAAARQLSGARRALYIIVMSSTKDYRLAIQALDNGADDFIRKPPFAEELRARLRAADRLTLMQRELIILAATDSLTGLLNRRAFFERASEACKEAGAGAVLSAVVFDIDHFKQVNDRHGHEAGDVVLATVAKVARMTGGIVGRLGGEEFCLLQHCELTDAIQVAEDLRCAIASLRFEPKELAITCSFGVAEWERGDTIDGLLRRADVALYEAKSAGRDRVVASNTFLHTKRHDEWGGITRSGKWRNQ